MNYRLIFLLSLFGLVMAFATVFLIPDKVEPLFWLAIFIVCAYLIAKNAPGRFFLHGLLTSLVNSVWITGAHVLLFNTYIVKHSMELDMMDNNFPSSIALHPRILMIAMGPVMGLAFGIVLGLFAFIASKMVKRNVSMVSNSRRLY